MRLDPGLVRRGRGYWIDGTRVPSVTSVCSYGSTAYNSVPVRVMREAAERGNWVHEATEALDLYNVRFNDKKLDGYVESWLCWLSATGFRLVDRQVEQAVFSRRWMYAGTADRIGEFHGRAAVVDIKTTRSKMPSHLLQISAYVHAWAEMVEQGPDAMVGVLVYLEPDGSMPSVIVVNEWVHFQNFLWNLSRMRGLPVRRHATPLEDTHG